MFWCIKKLFSYISHLSQLLVNDSVSLLLLSLFVIIIQNDHVVVGEHHLLHSFLELPAALDLIECFDSALGSNCIDFVFYNNVLFLFEHKIQVLSADHERLANGWEAFERTNTFFLLHHTFFNANKRVWTKSADFDFVS